MDCFFLFHWWKNFSERNTNCFLPTSIFFFALHTFYIYIYLQPSEGSDYQLNLLLRWPRHFTGKSSHDEFTLFLYVGIWLARFPWFFIEKKPSQPFTYFAITTTRPHPLIWSKIFVANVELVNIVCNLFYTMYDSCLLWNQK